MIRAARAFSVLAFSAMVLSACSPSNNVVLETELGNIHIDVHTKKAPASSADFLYHVDQGLYDNQGFYRVVHADNDPKDMGMSLIQGGRLDLYPVTPPIEHETTRASGLSNVSGAVTIARDEPGTGSAAFFFINVEDNTYLDHGGTRNPDGQGYAVFGTVTKGMEVVRAIQSQKANSDKNQPDMPDQFLLKPVMIKKAYRK